MCLRVKAKTRSKVRHPVRLKMRSRRLCTHPMTMRASRLVKKALRRRALLLTVVQPAPATTSTADASEHANPWLKILVVAAAVIAVILVATVLWNVVLEPTGDQLEDTVEDVVDATVGRRVPGRRATATTRGTAGGNGAGAKREYFGHANLQ